MSKQVANGNGNGNQGASDRIAGSEGWELGAVGGPLPKISDSASAGAGTSVPVGTMSDPPAPSQKVKAMSMLSGRSRRSKWGDDDAEPLGEVNKRLWLEVGFHDLSPIHKIESGIVSIESRRTNCHGQDWECLQR